MPGRVDGLELDVADHEGVAILEQAVVVLAAAHLFVEPLVLPVGVALVGDMDLRALLGQFTPARDEVGVDVGLGHGDDSQAVGRRDLLVAVHVALRVDDDGFPGALAPDQIRGLGQFVVIDHSQEHVRHSLGRHSRVALDGRRQRARDP